MTTAATELGAAAALAEFFGCGLHQVNFFILRIAMAETRPEWLRCSPKMKNLPRYDGKIKSNMIVVSRRLSQNEIGDAIVWTVEELNGPWNLTTDGFCFEDENEAMLFKLRWG